MKTLVNWILSKLYPISLDDYEIVREEMLICNVSLINALRRT